MSTTIPISKQFSFPPVCPCCMIGLTKETTGFDQIRADENAFGFILEALTSKRVMPISVPYCRPCSKHIKQYRTPNSWGCLVLLLAIGAIFVGAKIGLWGGIAAFVIPPVVFVVIGRPRRLRKAEALRSGACCKPGPSVSFSGLTAFVFENDAYGKAFAQINGFRTEDARTE